jgi:hypothetical protein
MSIGGCGGLSSPAIAWRCVSVNDSPEAARAMRAGSTKTPIDELTIVPLDEEFRFGLQLVLDGIELARKAAAPALSRRS